MRVSGNAQGLLQFAYEALCHTCAASCQLNVKGVSASGKAASGVGDVTQQQVSKGESAGKTPHQLKTVYRYICHASERQ